MFQIQESGAVLVHLSHIQTSLSQECLRLLGRLHGIPSELVDCDALLDKLERFQSRHGP